MIKIEIGRIVGESRWIGKAGKGVVGSETRDGNRLFDTRANRLVREVRGACMPAPLSDENREGDAFVAVVGDRFDLALADRHGKTDRLRNVRFGRRSAAGLRDIENGLRDPVERVRRNGKLSSG